MCVYIYLISLYIYTSMFYFKLRQASLYILGYILTNIRKHLNTAFSAVLIWVG